MQLKELLQGLPFISETCFAALPDDLTVEALYDDSRQVTAGSLFIAVPGEQTDGTAFIPEAVKKGAKVILAPAGTVFPKSVTGEGIVCLTSSDIRQDMALLAARFRQLSFKNPEKEPVYVAVTGTNGKSSTVDFLRQFWQLSGIKAASVGTLGVIAEGFPRQETLTTPGTLALSALLQALEEAGTDHIALEASSHGLWQKRLDGISLAAAGFISFSRDHLDYHKTTEAYLAAKLRLYRELLPGGRPFVAEISLPEAVKTALKAEAALRKEGIFWVGEGEEADLQILAVHPLPSGQEVLLFDKEAAQERRFFLPLSGRFQVSNVLMAAVLAMHTGVSDIWRLFEKLKPVEGRMESVITLESGGTVYVDYAHTPDALTKALTSLRPHCSGRLAVIFGAGGNRDKGKRPLMGEAAVAAADLVFVTDDNPRFEDPAEIRLEVMQGCRKAFNKAFNIAGREEAIRQALAMLKTGDILLVAGKGHEHGQCIAGEVFPFHDATVIRKLAAEAQK